MVKNVKITYDETTKKVTISSDSKDFDVSRIDGRDISDWLYPFMVKGIRWNGIHDEIRDFLGTEEFSIMFDSSEKNIQALRTALKDTNVKVAGTNNKVVILYKREPLSTKITINGKMFDTAKIQNRTIDEWVYPFQFGEVKWDGIFTELENEIGINAYEISFVGEQNDMKELINNCPNGVDITFKAPVAKGAPAFKGGSPINTASVANGAKEALGNLKQNLNGKNISEIAGNTLGKMSQEVSDDEINQNLQSIPIKNEFVRKNIMAICALLSIIFAIFPFMKSVTEASSEYAEAAASSSVTLTGFTALFGSHGSLVTAILFLGPILLIVMNYISQLKPYRRIIAIGIPALCIIFEIIVFFVLKGAINAGTGAAADMAAGMGVEQETSVTPQIGFFLLLISYILTAVVGFITYYGLQLPVKNSKGE